MKNHKLPVILLLLSLVVPATVHGQSIDDYISTLEIDTLLNHGPKDNRINLAFGNIASNPNENPYPTRSDLTSVVNEIINRFNPDDENPKLGFSHYHNFFNVYSMWFPDPIVYEAIPTYYEKTQGIRDALFLPWADEQHGWITMMYTGGGGNGAGVVRERRVGDATSSMDWATVFHEFNHTMAGLYDEYTASGEWANYQCLEGPNVTGQSISDEVPWRKWLPETPIIPTPYAGEYFDQVGLFEGNISGYFGCFRPTAQSCYMGAGGFGEGFGQEMCPVCLQRFITMLYNYVNVIENPLPASNAIEINGSETITFSADIIKPEPNTQKYEWFVNGKPVASGSESISLAFDACNRYEVSLIVTDTTEFVRYDEKFKDIYPEPRQTHTWSVEQNAVSDYDLAAEVIVMPSDCQAMDNGSISVSASGGLPPYTYTVNGQTVPAPIENLKPGFYSVVTSDQKGCSVVDEVEITQDQVIDFDICSSYYNESWMLTASIRSENSEGLSYLWSNGATGNSISGLQAGTYSLEMTNTSSCAITKEITLTEVESSIEVTHLVSNSSNDENNGSIYLSIYGGLAPYDIKWFKSEISDLTTYSPENVLSSGNGEINIHLPEFAFDDDLSFGYDFWAEGFTNSNYLGYDFGVSTRIEGYTITSNVDVKERDAKNWTFEGSNNGSSWETIQSITNFEFPERLQTFEFRLAEPANFRYYRIRVSENWGDSWVAIQQVEFGIYSGIELIQRRGKMELLGLSPGLYGYQVRDVNQSCREGLVEINHVIHSEISSPILISQDGSYKVKVENPDPALSYYWSSRKDGGELIHIGNNFQPTSPGQYYVRSFSEAISAYTSETKGMAITMETSPEVSISEHGLSVVNPSSGSTYVWYETDLGGTPVHTGITYVPQNNGYYYVSKRTSTAQGVPIDPASISGINFRMDASDLNGDGVQDATLASSSAYDWIFPVGGRWKADGWFPYRGNHQNGLGIVDFATMWFQYVESDADQMRTIILAYQESSFSRANSAPLHGVNNQIPKFMDSSQLFSSNSPATTLNGKTFLNGNLVNPLQEDNPMEFMILSVVLSANVTATPWASDEYWEGKLGELIIWDIPLSDSQIQGVNEFLQKKWISTAGLESPRVRVAWGENLLEDKDHDGFLEDVDCDDYNPNRNPNAVEICDGIDNNCDGFADENLTTTYYLDLDKDGFGDEALPIELCEEQEGYVLNSLDCNDQNDRINPNAEDIPNNGTDENCDGLDLLLGVIEDQSFTIYPNPSGSLLTISTSKYDFVNLKIINSAGITLQNLPIDKKMNLEIDFSEFREGLYFLELETSGGELIRRKFLKN